MLLFEPGTDKVLWSIYHSGLPEEGYLLPGLDSLVNNSSRLMANAEAIGYILSQGGNEITNPVTQLTFESLDQIENLIPLDQENNLLTYRLACTGIDLFPDIPQYLFCESAFFSSLPELSRAYALPIELFKAGIQRHGGDGLFHQWALEQAGQRADGHRVVSVHLGSNPNTASFLDSRPMDCSLGYSTLEGIPSRTGCGSIDPGISILLAASGLTLLEIENLLKHESGWKAIVGRPIQFNEVFSNESPETAPLRSLLHWSMVQSVGSAIASIGGLDILIFGGQDIQGSIPFIQKICSHFNFSGIRLLEKPKMMAGGWFLSAQGSTSVVLAMDYYRSKTLTNMAASAGF